MDAPQGLITNHLIIKNLLLDIKDRNQLMVVHFRGQEVKGTFAAFDPVMDGLRVVLDRKLDHQADEKVSLDFVYRKEFYTFDSKLAKSVGSSCYFTFPTQMTRHPNRESKRLNVLDKRIPVRIQFLGAGRRKAFRKDLRIEPAELDRLHHEVGQDVPDLAEIGTQIGLFLRRLGDKVDFKLGKLPKLFYPAEVMFREGRAYYMPDSSRTESYREGRSDAVLCGQIPEVIATEPAAGEEAGVKFWTEEYQQRQIQSELFAPIRVMGNVIGYLYVGTTAASNRLLSPNDVLAVLALADALSEAVVKRNINGKNDKGVYHIHLVDISEGGMQVAVTDPILNKILGVANHLMLSLNFFERWVRTYGEVVRALPEGETGEKGRFSIRFHQDEIPSSDRIYLKRIITYFETGGTHT